MQTRLTLTDQRVRPLTVRSATGSIPQVAVAVDSVNTMPMTFNITITPSLPVGRHEAHLAINTDDPEYPTLLVPVTIIKRASQRWLTSPVDLRFDAVTGRHRRLTVRDGQGQGVAISHIAATIPGVTAQVQGRTSTAATVLVTVAPSATLLEGELLLHLEGETSPLRIPIRVAPDERP